MTQFFAVGFNFVQKYIFSMPKLKTMVGANRSLSLWLKEQKKIFKDNKSITIPDDEKIVFNIIREIEKRLIGENAPYDNPLEQFQHGIIAAAGGHFEALINNSVLKKEDIQSQTLKNLLEITPDLNASVTMSGIDEKAAFLSEERKLRKELSRKKFVLDTDSRAIAGHPFLEKCSLKGDEPAVKIDSDNGNKTATGPSVQYFYKLARKKLEDTRNYDPAAFVESLVLKKYDNPTLGLPEDFSQFFTQISENYEKQDPKKYLALLVLDGNEVGSKLKKFQEKLPKDKPFITNIAATESYFYRIRTMNRVALTRALQETESLVPVETINDDNKSIQVVPFRVLMLGGDDVLMVMRAYDAIEFLIKYKTWWEKLLGNNICEEKLKNLPDKYEPMSFKAGVAMVPHNYPFHAAHDLAEQLAENAKQDKTAVDWHILFSSLSEDINLIRQREYENHYKVNDNIEKLALTSRPYPISCNGSPCLETQWKTACDLFETIKKDDPEEKIAKNKLKHLRALLQQGREESELFYQEFKSEKSDDFLTKIPETLFQTSDKKHFSTQMLDIIELMDLKNEYEKSLKKKEVSDEGN